MFNHICSLLSSRGLMHFVALPPCQGWCMYMMTWGSEVWSSPWQTWMPCLPSILQTGWDCPQSENNTYTFNCVSRNLSFYCKWQAPVSAFILQSMPENGTAETPPVVTPQSQPQAPSSSPSLNTSPALQPSEGPVSLSAEQVQLHKRSCQ